MNNSDFDRDAMEDFFDNLLDEEQRRKFLAKHESDESFESQLRLQNRINDVLLNRFQIDVEQQVNFPGQSDRNERANASQRLTRRSLLIVLAASFFGVMVYGFISVMTDNLSPYFSTTQLARLYQQEIDRGFRPYYECHDMKRFADTFEHRLGVGLTLGDMPADREMLGISYLGGLSRMTISMLCKVEGVPVIVFVDVAENANEALADIEPGLDLSVFRKQRDGIVFYELSPHAEAKMLDYFVFPED